MVVKILIENKWFVMRHSVLVIFFYPVKDAKTLKLLMN